MDTIEGHVLRFFMKGREVYYVHMLRVALTCHVLRVPSFHKYDLFLWSLRTQQNMRVNWRDGVLISCGCCNKFSQTGWLKMAEMYLLLLEARSQKSSYQQGLCPLKALGGFLPASPAAGAPWLLAASSRLCLCLHGDYSLGWCLLFCPL